MRIIAGEFKGRRLRSPEDRRVRPTSDKVKEAVFSMLSPYLYDSTAADLFAGTGSLGLEAISRGARRVYFSDRDRRSIALIRDNVAHCRAEDRSVILCSDSGMRCVGSANRSISYSSIRHMIPGF